MLNNVRLIDDQSDRVCWSFDKSGVFSVRSFLEKLILEKDCCVQNSIIVSKVWRGLVPPKAELLLWFVVQGRLNTKDRLRRMNLLSSADYRCVLCFDEDENLPHLFFTCPFSWKVWGACCQWWGIAWVFSDNPAVNFDSWIAINPSARNKKQWISCFYLVIWSLWDLRNKVIFHNKSVCLDSFMIELWNRWKFWST